MNNEIAPDIKYLAKRFATSADLVGVMKTTENRIFAPTDSTVDPGAVVYADFDFDGLHFHLDAELIVCPEYRILDQRHIQATSIGSFLLTVMTCSATDRELHIVWEADDTERQQLAKEISELIDPLLFWREVKVDKEKGTLFNPRNKITR